MKRKRKPWVEWLRPKDPGGHNPYGRGLEPWSGPNLSESLTTRAGSTPKPRPAPVRRVPLEETQDYQDWLKLPPGVRRRSRPLYPD